MLLDRDLNIIAKKLNKNKVNIICSSLDMCYLFNYKSSQYQIGIYATTKGEIYVVNNHVPNGLCITNNNINKFDNIDVIVSDNPLFTSKFIR